jgi:hypothetical protein
MAGSGRLDHPARPGRPWPERKMNEDGTRRSPARTGECTTGGPVSSSGSRSRCPGRGGRRSRGLASDRRLDLRRPRRQFRRAVLVAEPLECPCSPTCPSARASGPAPGRWSRPAPAGSSWHTLRHVHAHIRQVMRAQEVQRFRLVLRRHPRLVPELHAYPVGPARPATRSTAAAAQDHKPKLGTTPTRSASCPSSPPCRPEPHPRANPIRAAVPCTRSSR